MSGKILPHIVIVLAAMFITFWILDQLNPVMNFINNSISNVLLLLFSILSLVNGIFSIAWYRKCNK
jgi:fumarate reductase subunit D